MGHETGTPRTRSALYDAQSSLGATFIDAGGWLMPLRYTDALAEHRAVRNSVGLFDLSHLGKISVTGRGAAQLLDYALVEELSALAVGRATTALLCGRDGGVLDALTAYRLADDSYLVVADAANTGVVVRELRGRAANFEATVTNLSREKSLLAVQGPRAEEVLSRIVQPADAATLAALEYGECRTLSLNGREALVARTGYAGEDGFEVFVANENAVELWNVLHASGDRPGAVPCGLAARDSLRLEAGMPLHGNELSRTRIPYSAGLAASVSLSERSEFVGRSALEELRGLGIGTTIGRRLVGLQGGGRRSARSHDPVLVDGGVVGEVTSGLVSPSLDLPIALAYVDIAHSSVGAVVQVRIAGRDHQFEIVQLPFYRGAASAPPLAEPSEG